MQYDAALAHIDSITPEEVFRYERYFEHIRPKSNEDIFRRILFAYSTVHSTWRSSCKMYAELKDLTWVGDKDELLRRIKLSGAGLHNNRAKFISECADYYFAHPDWFRKSSHESWIGYRDRIMGAMLGLGHAKTSFTGELLYGGAAELVCCDVHVLRMYGVTPDKASDKVLRQVEHHWITSCDIVGVSPVFARWIYWDRTVNSSADPRFWAFVLERVDYNSILDELAA